MTGVGARLAGLRSLFYDVPWCVPAWGAAEASATAEALFGGRIVRGPSVERFAAEARRLLGARHALPVNRGRCAIGVALRALGVGPGDGVIAPSYVCRSVVEAIESVGARAEYADVGADLHVSAGTISAALSPRTRAAIVPHLFGETAPIDAIEKLLAGTPVALIDDAAQSLGARRGGRLAGTFGRCGILSCGPGKSLAGAAGGLLVTNDDALFADASGRSLPAERGGRVASRALSFWAWRRYRGVTLPVRAVVERIRPFAPEGLDADAGLSNLDAGIALAQLLSLEANAERRRANMRVLLDALGPASRWSVTRPDPDGMAVKLVLVLPEGAPPVRQAVEELAALGIEAEGGYRPCHLDMAGERRSLEVTDALWQRVLCIPVDIRFRRTAALAALAQSWVASAS